MKHTTKKLFSVGLALLLLVSVFASSVSAATLFSTKDYSKYEDATYVSLGDSVPAGYNVSNNIDAKGFAERDGSYPSVLRKALQANHTSYSSVGFRSVEMAEILGVEVPADYDYFHGYVLRNYSSADRAQTEEILETIADAELITVTVGSNDVFTGLLVNAYVDTVNELTNAEDYQRCMAKLNEIIAKYPSAKDFAELVDLLASLGKAATFLEKMTEQLPVGVNGYYTYFSAAMEILQETNPEDGTIVVTSMFDPYKGLDIEGGLAAFENGDIITAMSKLTNATGMMVKAMNAFLKSNANKYGYIYVDITKADLYSDHETVDVLIAAEEETKAETADPDFFGTFIAKAGDPHPTEAGNEYIAQQIIDKLPVKDKAVAAPAEVVKAEPTLKDVALLYQWYIGNTTLPDDVQSSCDLNDNGSIDLVDVSMAYWMVVSGK